MQTISQVKQLRAAINAEKQHNQRIALVPTMGNLHEGHLQLVRRAHEIADVVIVSIFVNPMQFGANEDFDNYPRTLAKDQKKLQQHKAQYLFVPENNEIYPHGTEIHTTVDIPSLTNILCGESRPIHFSGVCTVVNKLLNLVQPTYTVFGEKDYQQLFVIQHMVDDLCIPVDIVGVPTVREPGGLAMSSRNNYLTDTQKESAGAIYLILKNTQQKILSGNFNFTELCIQAKKNLHEAGLKPDYFEIRHPNNLQPINNGESASNFVILAAAWLGNTRLIDNIHFSNNT